MVGIVVLKLTLHGISVVSNIRPVSYFKSLNPTIKQTISNTQSLGYIRDRMLLVDNLSYRLIFELSGEFCYLYLNFSYADFDK